MQGRAGSGAVYEYKLMSSLIGFNTSVLDIDSSDQETKQGKVVVGIKLQPKNLQGQRVSRYRNADTLSLPIVESTVDGCNMRCPTFNSGMKYLVVVKDATINKKQIKSEKYYIIQYASGEKTEKFDELNTCS